MPDDFRFDVFLSHSAKDKPMVRELAARLNKNGVRVWLDEEQIKPGDSIPAKIEAGLEHSRVLVLCMSAKAFGSDWAQLDAGTCGRRNLRFRDPLNQERRFIPLRLDDAPIKGSLAQLFFINCSRRRRNRSRRLRRLEILRNVADSKIQFSNKTIWLNLLFPLDCLIRLCSMPLQRRLRRLRRHRHAHLPTWNG